MQSSTIWIWICFWVAVGAFVWIRHILEKRAVERKRQARRNRYRNLGVKS